MSVASSRNRIRQNPCNWNHLSSNINMQNSHSLSEDAKFQRSMDRLTLFQSLNPPNTDLETETEEIENLLENQKSIFVYSGAMNYDTGRTGGCRHVEGIFDGTDVSGNIGFAEGSMMHTDANNFPLPDGNTESVASHAQSQLFHHGFQTKKIHSSGIFHPFKSTEKKIKAVIQNSIAPLRSSNI